MKQKSFTIIELMVVIAIIVLIASIIFVALGSAREKARIAKGLQFSASVHHALGAYAVGIWDFDDQADPTADASGNGNDGDLVNDPIYRCASTDPDYTPSGKGCSLEFDGSNDYVDVGNDSSLNNFGTGGITVSSWVYVIGEPNNNFPAIFEKGTGDFSNISSNQKGIFLSAPYRNNPARNIRWAIGNGSGYDSIYYSISNSDLQGKWHHIVGIADNQSVASPKLRLYLNGIVVSTTDRTKLGPIDVNTVNANIGRWRQYTRYFNGIIDDVRIYEQSLSSAQIRKLYVEGARERGLLAEE